MAPVLSESAVVFLKIVALTGAVLLFFRTRAGDSIGRFLPSPFWIYFLAIVSGTTGFLPSDSPAYTFISQYILTSALFLMLIGTPVTQLVRMGPRALLAIVMAILTMVLSAFISYAVFARFLPPDAWKAVGALLGTWVGGSANMLAVKEILAMPDPAYTPLIIVDTVLSYAWMALLVLAAAHQARVDRVLRAAAIHESEASSSAGGASADSSFALRWGTWAGVAGMVGVLAVAYVMSQIVMAIAGEIAPRWTLLSKTAWALLLMSTATIFLAMTPLSRLGEAKAGTMGQFLLCVVLVSIGAKTTLNAALQAPVYLAFGALMLILHGVLMLVSGRLFRLPLFFLSTASQAAVGGPVSAPIVAGVYRSNQAHIGVLMAVFGALVGTYVGVAGGWVCKIMFEFIH